MTYVLILKVAFLLAPFSPLPLIFFFFLKKYCYIIYFFLSKGGQSNPAVRGYFGHPCGPVLKVAFGVNLYKYSISVVSFPHKSSIFNDIFLIQYHKIDSFASRLKLSVGLLWPPTKTEQKCHLNGFIKKFTQINIIHLVYSLIFNHIIMK